MLPKALVAASLQPIMLSLLAERAMYGYELTQRASALSDGKIAWAASKLYPTLHDLENKGLVSSFWQRSESGPDRKYYRLTPPGEQALAKAKADWLDLNHILAKLWGPELALGGA